MLAHHKLIEKRSYIQSEIDFDVSEEIEKVEDCRNAENDSEPPEIQKLSTIAAIKEELSELYKLLTANKQYEGPKTETEIGRMLRDIHLNSLTYVISHCKQYI